jgi:DNA repair exonuclease SbcCD ATPase subunit
MIIFKSVRWKNFLSTGNIFTEIKLNETANALIIGENGAGKSTILDALTFSLFGKAFRKINKPGLVNSVNQKGCVVEIEFDTNGKAYKVIRGIKPNVFEIYCDGLLLNQDSASRDYQEHLEKFVLKMNYKSFTQIVILGSASFTPFMQLSPADRRTVIEDLLDIQIFSTMNIITKQKLVANKDLLERNRIELVSKEEKKVFIEKTLSSLKTNNEEKKKHLQSQIELLGSSYDRLGSDIEELEKERVQLVSQFPDHTKFKDRHRKLVGLQAKIEANLGRFEKEHSFFCDNNTCPTCSQSLDQTFKAEKIKDAETKITELEKGLGEINTQIEDAINSIAEVDRVMKKIDSITGDISVKRKERMHLGSTINDLEDQVDALDNADKIVIDNQTELDETILLIETMSKDREALLNDRKYIETAINLLKDGGIKTKIIKQYLPIINKLINKYLAQMGFFVNFNIDESFEETIKSRYRDEFSYHNFSEGEKMRIDLALLFTWRSVAKMRNSVNTNLLILDEVFDGSLDGNGTDEFLKIMWSMIGDTNTFVISHKTDQLFDKFQKVYRFSKIKNFSQLTV